MASIIRVKRSTGTLAPATLNYGELGLTIGVGTHGNKGGRLFAGDNSSNPQVVGGRYYTDLLSIAPGKVAGQVNPTTAANGFVAIVDETGRVDQWNVDNLRLDGNALTSTDIDGHITITPNGIGRVQFLDDDELQFGTSDDIRLSYDTVKDALFFERGSAGNTADIRIADDIHFQFGTDNDARIYYDEATSDRIQVEGASWTYATSVAQVAITTNTASTDYSNGALIVEGGVGVGGTVNIRGDLSVQGGDVTSLNPDLNLFNSSVTTLNAFSDATTIAIGSTSATLTLRPFTIVGTDATQNLYNTVTTTVNAFSNATTLGIGSTTATLTLRPSTVVGTDTTQNLYNTVATTVNAFGDASTLNIGNNSGTLTLRNPTVVGTEATQNLYNTVTTTVNAFSNATTLAIGATTATLTLRPSTVVGTDTIQNLYNTVATTVNAFGEASALTVGATTGVATVRNLTFEVPNATTINLGAASSTTTVTFSSTPNTSYVSIASTQNATSISDGALRVAGGVGIASDLYLGGSLIIAGSLFDPTNANFQNINVTGNTNLGNGPTDLTVITGIVTHYGSFANIGGMTIDNIGISSNTIATRPGAGNVLYLDPYPDGLSNEGTVIIKGDLQVDGTTTTVNSNNVTVNDPILLLGDVTSKRTVMSTVGTGVSAITLDSVTGINTGDLISGSSSLPGAGTTSIHSYDPGLKIVYIDGVTTGGISTTTQLTVTHAYDTNTDRGISFDYNTSSGVENNKTGFFGYHDTTNSGSSAPVRSWTYIPDATITNSVVTGTRGYLDIKGIYYQTGDYDTHGVVYFDVNGLQTSTNNPNTASSTRTSTQLLTAVTEITIDLPSSYSVTAGQQVTQVNNSAAYGVVKTTTSGTTITLIGVQGTFDTTNDLKVEGSNISIVPSTVTTVYTNKPTWTDTLDGGTF